MTIVEIILTFLTHKAASSAWHSPKQISALLPTLRPSFIFSENACRPYLGNGRSLVNKDKAQQVSHLNFKGLK